MAARGIGGIAINVETIHVKAAIRALGLEADGRALRSELARNLRTVLQPVRDQARANILAMPVTGGLSARSRAGAARGLRSSIAAQTEISTRLSGRVPTVALVAGKKTPGFANAPRRFNAASFRHPVFGHLDRWVGQVGRPDWFNDPVRGHTPEYTAAVVLAVHDLATRVAERSNGGA